MIAIPAFIWGICSSALTVLSLFPYIYKTLKGVNRPHIFTWIIWSLLTAIAFTVQYSAGAGPGSWATGLTCVCAAVILLISIRHGEKNITLFDWLCFLLALAAIPVWMATKNAALAGVWVTLIDGLAYLPTARKVWHKPHEEVALPHAVANAKHIFSLLGMQTISVATAFYPVCLFVFNLLLIGLILGRRRVLCTRNLDYKDGVGSIETAKGL